MGSVTVEIPYTQVNGISLMAEGGSTGGSGDYTGGTITISWIVGMGISGNAGDEGDIYGGWYGSGATDEMTNDQIHNAISNFIYNSSPAYLDELLGNTGCYSRT